MAKCGRKTEVYSRVCGYFRPVAQWNKGAKERFKEMKYFKMPQTTNQEKENPASREKEM
jgi:ribonucleoside-triphosphate reductase